MKTSGLKIVWLPWLGARIAPSGTSIAKMLCPTFQITQSYPLDRTMPSNALYFRTDPTWEAFAAANGLSLSPTAIPPPTSLDIAQMRSEQLSEQAAWSASHPLSSVGYESRTQKVTVRDGFPVEIKISRSTRAEAAKALPLVFVCHGGGWVRGTHVSEEVMLLGALYEVFDLVVVSVDYRRVPDEKYPVFLYDCWDVLSHVYAREEEFGFDEEKIILAGSSVGGQITGVLSQWARGYGIGVKGVVLNVPVLCDPRHFPKDTYEGSSYGQAVGALLNSGVMEYLWKLVIPDGEKGKHPDVSPLLGKLENLPPHLLYVAGQDPVRDDGIAYGRKLESSGVPVTMRIYQGVPHTFNEYWGQDVTERFWADIRRDLAALLA